jgi:uncharacterized protein (TIGR00369 family)
MEVPVTTTDDAKTMDFDAMLGEFNKRIGVRLVEVSPERIVGTVPVEGNRQPYGLIHGGVNAALAETLGSIAAVLNCGGLAVGVELSCTHHRSARSGLVTGVCTPIHVGRQVSTFETVITDENGKRTCTARLTCFAVNKVPGDATPA